MNREQRRKIQRLSKAKKNGESFSSVIGAKQVIEREVRQSVHDDSIRMESEIKNERFMWESIVALNNAFGFEQEDIIKYLEALGEVTTNMLQDAEVTDLEYAVEQVRKRASQIAGYEFEYLYDKEIRAARTRNEARGIFFHE